MKLSRDAQVLKDKALSSLRIAIVTFNSLEDDGRPTATLMSIEHAHEMLLKAALVHLKQPVFDKKTQESISFKRAIRVGQGVNGLKITDAEAGTLRTIGILRDEQQHWYGEVEEGLLYVHTHAAVTAFDDILYRVFGESLAELLPRRVLPISVEPPQDFHLLVDREYNNIKELLSPGRRAGAEARGRIRTLLALEAHTDEDATVSERDVRRVERAIKDGRPVESVFPKLGPIATTTNPYADGIGVEVRFTKGDAMSVTYAVDDPDAVVIRQVDLNKKFHRSPTQLAADLGLTPPKALALRRHLGIDSDPKVCHTFHFGKTHHVGYSDHAFTRMRDAVDTMNMNAIWASHSPNPSRKAKPACTEAECAGTS